MGGGVSVFSEPPCYLADQKNINQSILLIQNIRQTKARKVTLIVTAMLQ